MKSAGIDYVSTANNHCLDRGTEGLIRTLDQYETLGKHKTCLLIFFNNSLRTRLSTQKAARNLGMDVIVLDVNQGAWKLETERGVIMDGDKSEHLLEAILTMPITKHNFTVRKVEDLADTMRAAFRIAQSGRKGPVLVDIPKDVH